MTQGKHSVIFKFFLLCLLPLTALAAHQEINFHVAKTWVNFSGKTKPAIAINGQIPGPTLRFTEGDVVTINVYNDLKEGTSIHWHGLLVPWQMDGVAWVTQKPIPPGGVFHYHYRLKQAGTYWYHSHFELQEQDGQYGAIVIEPKHPTIHADEDYVVLLSDWVDVGGDKALANLKKSGDFYSLAFPLRTSLFDFLKDLNHAKTKQEEKYIWKAYLKSQKTRMGLYDISDIAYDAFLMNGHPPSRPWVGQVKIGDRVRLRVIGAGASSFFNVKVPGTTLQVVQKDGSNVVPYYTDSINLGPGETYDVIVKITHPGPYYIYAQSADLSGAALGALITSSKQTLDFNHIASFPKPPMRFMMPPKPPEKTVTKYSPLKAPFVTNDVNKPVYKTIRMALTGNMDRYIWSLNGIPEDKAKPEIIIPGKRYRLIFINKTLMHHPMHIHGHWFILRKGYGAYDPLLHTVDVPPLSTVIVDFDANEKEGQWYFHCHNLYHLMTGMATIFRYDDHLITKQHVYSDAVTTTPNKNNKHKPATSSQKYLLPPPPPWYYSTNIDLLGNSNNNFQGSFLFYGGANNNKLQLNMKDAEIEKGILDTADLDIFYWHAIARFWAIKGGANYVYRPSKHPYWQPGLGIEGTAPFYIETDLRTYMRKGSAKFDLELTRDTWIVDRLFFRISIRPIWATRTIEEDELGAGLNSVELVLRPFIQLNPNLNVFVEFDQTRTYGNLSKIVRSEGGSTRTTNYFVGFNLLI